MFSLSSMRSLWSIFILAFPSRPSPHPVRLNSRSNSFARRRGRSADRPYFLTLALTEKEWRGKSCLSNIALTPARSLLYIVHMKNVTASEARKNWFRLLDEALDGEVIAVQRKGRRLVLRREELADNRNARGTSSPCRPVSTVSTSTRGTRQYKRLLRVPSAEKADRWSWEWRGPESTLVSRRRTPR